jgi:hypothetical protein
MAYHKGRRRVWRMMCGRGRHMMCEWERHMMSERERHMMCVRGSEQMQWRLGRKKQTGC